MIKTLAEVNRANRAMADSMARNVFKFVEGLAAMGRDQSPNDSHKFEAERGSKFCAVCGRPENNSRHS